MERYSSLFYKADQRTSRSSGHTRVLGSLAQPFGQLACIEDVFLSPEEEMSYSDSSGLLHVFLPVSGLLAFRDNGPEDRYLAPEEALFFCGETLLARNPAGQTPVNYLHIALTASGSMSKENRISSFSLRELNQMTSLSAAESTPGCFACAGVFTGRAKSSYALKDPENGLFVYIVNGAFEVEGRLMEHRDGLALWDISSISFESLSEFGILLLFEISLAHSPHQHNHNLWKESILSKKE